MSPTWRQLLAEAERRLDSTVDARRIVEEASGYGASSYVEGLDQPATAKGREHFEIMVERRAGGEPLQYVLGGWGFRRLDLYLDRRALIPRPETETVVQVARDVAADLGRAPVIADLGTGSGAIALALAVEIPDAQLWATDVSADALEVARANLAGAGSMAASRVRLAHGSWFEALPSSVRGRLQLIVSNPPYVGDDEDLPAEVGEWEPACALRAGPTGMEHIETIVSSAPEWLARPAALVVEIAPHQAAVAAGLAEAAGFAGIEVRQDLTGRDRMILGRF